MLDYEAIKGGVAGTVLSAVGAGMSVTDLQAIISIVATVIGLIITIMTGVVIPLIKKYKAAKEDGKITTDEVLDLVETATDGLNKVKEEITKEKEN